MNTRGTIRLEYLAASGFVVPVVATHLAWALNLVSGAGLPAEFHCNPYWDGCLSVSRAVRSGPGLPVFRALMLPTAMLLMLTWWLVPAWLAHHAPQRRPLASAIGAAGVTGALFLTVYVAWLGTEGGWSGWLRRYGVIMYFGLTGLAQLCLLRALWSERWHVLSGRLRPAIAALLVLVCLQWTTGLLSATKRVLWSSAALIDRIENSAEWVFALAMSGGFLAMAWMFRADRARLEPRRGD